MADDTVPNPATTPLPSTTPNLGFSGMVSGILDLIHGVSGQAIDRSQQAAAAADPFAAQRPQYQSTLQGLLQNPGSFVMDPGATFARDQGLEAVARHGNAMFGTTRAGNTAVELERFATGFGEQQYNKRIDQLLTLSGATTGSPAAAAQALTGGFQQQDKNIAGGLRGLDSLLSALGITPQTLLGMGKQGIDLLKGVLGPNFDFSGANMGGSVTDFLTSIGVDPSSLSQSGQNILDPSGTASLSDGATSIPGLTDGLLTSQPILPGSVTDVLDPLGGGFDFNDLIGGGP